MKNLQRYVHNCKKKNQLSLSHIFDQEGSHELVSSTLHAPLFEALHHLYLHS